ncbi:Seven-in-absentia protein, sina [Corchorus capsularis]|uniref:Seven-in-absentia protein, sina n=1 Tax=Corchorus capsularis TaxID=210143 RepID=A0A1R3I006_COCAP|nr:Seven-in-absentia protein, sina [Corchorus capsularis]
MSLTDPEVVDCSVFPICQDPNEGGELITSLNVEENVGSEEGKRKNRKKKKQVSTPRPACSWVYFSREFIKEYRASHPESSGLKAATKAASDAWKVMSAEDKEKYTQRSREVWDNYLSTIPARIPKPRKQTKLVTRCSPGRLFNVLQRLTSEQKDAVKSMGFGSLLGLRCRTLRRSLCLWLLERFNPARRSLEICGERIPLSPTDVEHVMGLAACGKDVVNSGPDDLIADLRHSYNATNRGISVRLLEERLAAPEAGEDFKRSFILYALGTLLSPTARLDVSPSFLHFLINMDVVHQYNWGKFLLDRLVREVSRFRQGKQRAVGGCLLFLQLFYYESISIEGAGSSAPMVVPCLSSWGEEEITEREKREREFGGYGRGEMTRKDRFLGSELAEYRVQVEGLSGDKISSSSVHNPMFEREGTQATEDQMNGDFSMEEENVARFSKSKGMICGDMELIVEAGRTACRNREYGCCETVDYTRNNDHEENCIFAPCACPLTNCNFVGSSEQLSLHFSSKHWDSGRRFRYNIPLHVTLGMNGHFLVLQAEEDGILFILNKAGVESIGNMVTVTCIAPSSSKEKFLYDLISVSAKGISSLRLKSLTENFPGRVEGFPPLDFLLIPYRFLGPSGELNLEVCIWNSTELVSDCP